MSSDDVQDIYETPIATPSFKTELAAHLFELVPEAVADGKVDVEKLKELLDDDAADGSERFGLFWPGKKRALRAAQEPTTATLNPDFENSKDWDTTKNVFIEGDNLEVLKLLQKHYHGRIKVIYIDPPYNTGKDFVYPDNYREGLATYLEWTRQVNEEGKKVSSNSESEGRYHSNWLNMMYPRLKLARNLLTEDGAIFISIDDSEAADLLLVCREIFGEANVIGTLIHQRAKGGGQAKFVVRGHDYLVAICRNIGRFAPMLRPKVVQQPTLTIDGVEYIKNDDVVRRSFGKYDRSVDRRCFYEELEEIKGIAKKQEIDAKIAAGQLHLELSAKSGMHVIYELIPVDSATSKIYSIIRVLSEEGKNDLAALGMEQDFDYPKPVDFVRQVIQSVVLADRDATVLDFFSGSGTTAHAVMQLNADDGGNRRHIQVQLPEPTEEGSHARASGHQTIASVARERISRAGESIIAASIGQLSDRSDPLDVGYRSYKLIDTNFTKWRMTSEVDPTTLEKHLLDLRDSADDGATPDSLLTEVLLRQGYSLTEQICDTEVEGLKLKSVGGGLVLAYLDEQAKPTLDQLRAALGSKDLVKFMILEDAFKGDDELKTNLVQEAKTRGVELWTA
jgi:adenine-specific DNA-methyltransferase